MPKMSDTMTEGVIATWHKKVGDKVKSGDVLAEVETDKEGNFSFILPQGAAGKLSAEANIYEIRFEECAAVKELRKTHSGMASVFSNVVAIDGQSSRGDITLSFRLPYCKCRWPPTESNLIAKECET